jgi:hypothetical protein
MDHYIGGGWGCSMLPGRMEDKLGEIQDKRIMICQKEGKKGAHNARLKRKSNELEEKFGKGKSWK